MSERFIGKVTDIKEIGYSGVIKYLLADYLQKRTSLPIIIEPQPVSLSEPHIRLMYTGIDIESGPDITGYNTEKLYTLKMDLLVTLTAEGDGPDVFLDKIVAASFALSRVFENAFCIGTCNGNGISVNGNRRPGGQFFKNEEEGKRPYLYEENYEVSIYMPYVEVNNG
jgi:hypothetical protein